MLSRVADSLFWLSRYIERAENNARILDVNSQLMLDFENQSDEKVRAHWEPIINSLEERELFFSMHKEAKGESVTEFVAFETRNFNSICSCLALARENARTVREQISTEMWEHINRMYLFMHSGRGRKTYVANSYEFFKRIQEGSQLFQGITDSTMTHSEGWDFMQLGRFIERADRTSRILDIKYHILLPSGESVGGNVDTIHWMAVLRSCSALEAYRKIHVGQVAPWRVAEFLILHDRFPRSIRFCVDRLDAALHRISGCDRAQFSNEAERLSGRLCSLLDYETIGEIFGFGLHQYLDRTQLRLVEIGDAMNTEFCEWLEPEMAQSQSQSG